MVGGDGLERLGEFWVVFLVVIIDNGFILIWLEVCDLGFFCYERGDWVEVILIDGEVIEIFVCLILELRGDLFFFVGGFDKLVMLFVGLFNDDIFCGSGFFECLNVGDGKFVLLVSDGRLIWCEVGDGVLVGEDFCGEIDFVCFVKIK